MSSLWLNKFRRDVLSQNGEDGVIEAIFQKIGATNRWCCDLGAHDGLTHSNVATLIFDKNWDAVLIERDEKRFTELLANMTIPRAVKLCRYVRPDTFDDVLAETKIPKDFDLLNIDVDCEDCQIWDGLKNYRPRVAIVEVDSCCAPGSGAKSVQNMTTLEDAVAIGKRKGYELALHTGNAIFVLREHVKALDIDPENWQELFDRKWVA